MTYIRTEFLTSEQALELEHMGFILRLLQTGLYKDLYAVYVKNI